MRRPRQAFTLIEFLVLIGIITILIGIIIPYLVAWREDSRRIECISNLRQIGEALQRYTTDNGAGTPFPQTFYDRVHKPAGYTAFTGPDGGVKANDITASLWLLVRGGYVKDPAIFVCPSTSDQPDTLTDEMGKPVAAQRRWNFRSALNLSYSYASPFTDAFPMKFSSDYLKGAFAVMADKNPGFDSDGSHVLGPARDASPFVLAKGNSPNHHRAGQNVLHPAGDVSFETTPYCGVSNDNIYTAAASHGLPTADAPLDKPGFIGPDIGPAYEYDSYLVPTARDGFGN